MHQHTNEILELRVKALERIEPFDEILHRHLQRTQRVCHTRCRINHQQFGTEVCLLTRFIPIDLVSTETKTSKYAVEDANEQPHRRCDRPACSVATCEWWRSRDRVKVYIEVIEKLVAQYFKLFDLGGTQLLYDGRLTPMCRFKV